MQNKNIGIRYTVVYEFDNAADPESFKNEFGGSAFALFDELDIEPGQTTRAKIKSVEAYEHD